MLTPIMNLIINSFRDMLSGMDKLAIAWHIAAAIPSILSAVKSFMSATPLEKVDEALEQLDLRTGTDDGAIDVIESLPQDKEEELFDALKTIAAIMIKNAMKDPEYYSKRPN